MPEAIVALGEAKRVVGRLRFEAEGGRQHSQFEYAESWLAAEDRFALAPGLPLRPGGHYASARDSKRDALSGCFADAAPDSWGRALLTRALGGGLTEFDYLVLSDDWTRHGALRFLNDEMEPLSALSPPVPRLVDLEALRAIAQRFERDPGTAEAAARDLAGVAGSLGGARPKASVEGDGALWIAKFTSRQDTRPVERVEVATLRLAQRCGLRVSEARLELAQSEWPVALIKRFDRRGSQRIPFISARTALDWNGDAPGSYSDIADVIRQISSRPSDDLRELWRRIVFTILITNTDDHLKNHGFIYAGGDRWRLSPAFDINPSPQRQRRLETAILRDGGFDASIEFALDGAVFFDIGEDEARSLASELAVTIKGHWASLFQDNGVSVHDLESYRAAFEHEAAETAEGLAR